VASPILRVARVGGDDKKARKTESWATENPFRILVATPSRAIAIDVEKWAETQGHVFFAAARNCDAVSLAREYHPEVFVVDLLFEGGKGVATGIELLAASPGGETVFVVESLDLPEMHAARDVGVTRFVQTADLPRYLSLAVVPLARLARARRAHDEAQRVVDALPSWSEQAAPSTMPLAVAERRFRESYLRASLAKGGDRRATAHLAGVPYTTLCVMLRKLGIAPEPDDIL
jgi:DNA-binding NtrC family response regulator